MGLGAAFLQIDFIWRCPSHLRVWLVVTLLWVKRDRILHFLIIQLFICRYTIPPEGHSSLVECLRWFINNRFLDSPIAIGGSESTVRETPVFWNSTMNDRHNLPLLNAHDLFNKPDWMCRNQTLPLAFRVLLATSLWACWVLQTSRKFLLFNSLLTPLLTHLVPKTPPRPPVTFSTTRTVY